MKEIFRVNPTLSRKFQMLYNHMQMYKPLLAGVALMTDTFVAIRFNGRTPSTLCLHTALKGALAATMGSECNVHPSESDVNKLGKFHSKYPRKSSTYQQ